jgi:hypothetical protein
MNANERLRFRPRARARRGRKDRNVNSNQMDADTSIAELTEQAADLAARAVGSGLARLIAAYVPARLADRFAMRVAVVLLREVQSHEEAVARPPFCKTH